MRAFAFAISEKFNCSQLRIVCRNTSRSSGSSAASTIVRQKSKYCSGVRRPKLAHTLRPRIVCAITDRPFSSPIHSTSPTHCFGVLLFLTSSIVFCRKRVRYEMRGILRAWPRDVVNFNVKRRCGSGIRCGATRASRKSFPRSRRRRIRNSHLGPSSVSLQQLFALDLCDSNGMIVRVRLRAASLNVHRS